ncbi:MAG: GWxTD domain-containing protein [Cryomorphaceae bacterium]|jgi:GWxTD domain-containing protein
MMTANRLFGILGILMIGSLFQTCSSSSEVSSGEVPTFYGDAKLKIEPKIKLFHQSSDSTTVFVKFDTENLLYIRRDEEYEASVIVEIDPIPGKAETTDRPQKKTVSVPAISKDKKGATALVKTNIYLPKDNNYNVTVTIRDESNGKRLEKLIAVNKDGANNRENFLLFEQGSSTPLFTDRIKSNTSYDLDFGILDTKVINVNYYNRSFPLPPPPFAYYEPKPFNYEPDEQFVLTSDSNEFNFTSKNEGFYHFRVDTAVKEGFTLFVSSEEFPEVQNVQNMVDPFRYLVSGKEYKKLLEAPALKVEMENFWVDWAGDRNRARNNIETYYNRVETANRFFSSHLEGWKSDRGLIYLIYGEPDKIYKTAQEERWIYGEERNALSITFRFIKVDNPFTENDYRLSREDYYKPSWYRSIEAWRNGRIY